MTIVLSGTTGITTPTTSTTGEFVTSVTGFKNRIINGAMVIDQRNAGASLAVTAGTVQYSVDRFFGISTNAQCTLQQVATSDADFPYALRLARTTSGVGTGIIQGGQIIETNNCQDLAGQTVAFSFYATAGANFSAASSQIVVGLTCGSGTNQGAAAAFLTGTWTSQTTPLSTTQAITTTRTKYTYSVSIPSGTNEIGIRWYYTPVGTAGANDWFQITGVQLEKGSTATSFDYRPYGTELALCQRYYQQWGGETAYTRICLAQARSTTAADIVLPLMVAMRTAPTFSSSGTVALSNSSSGFLTITSYTNDSSTTQVLQFLGNVASGLTAGNATQFGTNNDTAARFKVTAEL